MPDTKITALTAISTVNPATYPLPIVDTADTTMAASGTTKKITVNQILGSGGTATLASATITGDLTVDTNTLKVDSANNRVGIGTATPGTACDVASGTVRVKNAVGDLSGLLIYQDTGDASKIFNYYNGSIQFGINNTTAMTLNATGLGVGRTPGARLDTQGTTSDSSAYAFFARNSVGNAMVYIRNDGRCVFGTGASDNIFFEPSGNVGIGVTPSAWASAFGSVLQFKSAGSSAGGSLTGSSADNFRMFSNTYYDGAYKYIAAGFATQYEQSAGSHVWYLSGTTAGAINGAITFSTALSLDKTGSLVLGSAAVATTATDGFLYIPSCAGAPTGVPTTKTGRVPMVVDSTNNRFYVYVGGTWKYTTLA